MDTESLKRYFAKISTDMEFKEFQKLLKSENLDNKSLENSEVVKLLKELLACKDKQLVHSLSTGTELFRCRKLEHRDKSLDGVISYDSENDVISGSDAYNSKEPPITVSGAGRNNIRGCSYLYLAEDAYTACAEIRPNNFDIISLAKFRIKRDLKIFDLATNDKFDQYDNGKNLILATRLISWIMSAFYLPVASDREYLMSQYISDFIRKYGYDGICYRSSMTFNKNYTIFNCGENNIEFVESELIVNHGMTFNLHKVNDASKVLPKESKILTRISDEDIKKDLIKRIREDEQWKL